VYFANYVAFITRAERAAIVRAGSARARGDVARDVRRRRLAYYGNAECGDRLRLRVDVFGSEDPDLAACRCLVVRERDDRLIGVSESIVHLRARP
jgi:probable biosynthetic protein (TIGR04098 family)